MNYNCQVHNQCYDGYWVAWSRNWMAEGNAVSDRLFWAEQKSVIMSKMSKCLHFRCLPSLKTGAISNFCCQFSTSQALLICCPCYQIQKVHDSMEVFQYYKYRQSSDAIVAILWENKETITNSIIFHLSWLTMSSFYSLEIFILDIRHHISSSATSNQNVLAVSCGFLLFMMVTVAETIFILVRYKQVLSPVLQLLRSWNLMTLLGPYQLRTFWFYN